MERNAIIEIIVKKLNQMNDKQLRIVLSFVRSYHEKVVRNTGVD